MAENTDGGPAFPRPVSEDGFPLHVTSPAQDGMSLRDYFAAQALVGMLGNADLTLAGARVARQENHNPVVGLCVAAYEYADAMLRARKS